MKQLKLIKGIGKQKIKAFGQEILDVVRQYCENNSTNRELLSGSDIDNKTSEKLQKEKQSSTRVISFDLYKQGKSIAAIAAERNLTIGTIEGHVSEYVLNGELSISEFIDTEKLSIITSAFEKHGVYPLNRIKEELGQDFSYGELKLVQAYLRFLKK